MKDIIELKNLLSSMNETLKQHFEVEKQKTAVLEKGGVEELNTLINSEQALIMECSTAEKQRMKICDRMKAASISELLETNPEANDIIAPVHKEMVDIIKEIKKVSGLNMRLLDTRLKIVKFMTSQMGINENQTYGKNAQINS